MNIYLSDRLKDVLTMNGISPENYRPAYESVGLDLYYCGYESLCSFDRGLAFQNTYTWEKLTLLPTGLHVVIPPGWVGLVMERGSITKTSLIHRSGVIDPGYSGEVFVNLEVLPLKRTEEIKPGQKLPVQLICIPVDNQFTQITLEEFNLQHAGSLRREGKVGSSDIL